MGRFNLKSLQTRTASALILIPAVLFAVVSGGWLFALLIAALACVSIYEWIGIVRKTDKPIIHALWGLVYLGVGFAACVLIREEQSFLAAVLFLLMIWSSDIGAYFTGKSLGGPKMAPKISPNKTWTGFAGACDFPACIGVIFYLGYNFFADAPIWSVSTVLYVFVLGLIVGFAGQAGDLLVSWLKRQANVKDTGALIPGHGGILDRIDAMLLSAPVFYFFFNLFGLDF